MRIPGESESSAFAIAIAVALLGAVAAISAVVVTPLYGLAVLGVGAVAALAFELMSTDPDRRMPLAEAAHAPHPHAPPAGTWRVLVVANEALSGPALRDEIVRRGGPRVRVEILAPVLTTRSHHWTSDDDRELQDAGCRLEASLAWAASQGLEAHGRVGDPDPATALEDELRDVGADEVIVVTHPRAQAARAESGEVERLRRELDVPVGHVVLDRERGSAEVVS
jgi:hypothetical protein